MPSGCSITPRYSPPVHLQQLRKALVSKEEMKRVEGILKQVPARQLALKPIEDLSKKLRRDLRNAEHLTTCMERVSLITTEQARELSRINNKLYECVLQEEAKPQQD